MCTCALKNEKHEHIFIKFEETLNSMNMILTNYYIELTPFTFTNQDEAVNLQLKLFLFSYFQQLHSSSIIIFLANVFRA